jgi:erythrin-vacuolar iron transport family protein
LIREQNISFKELEIKIISASGFEKNLFMSKLKKEHSHQFVIQKVQPALLGLMDGSVSTLAPIFATAGLTDNPLKAFYVGLAASLGAGISMGLAEALSDDGKVTGRGNPVTRGSITALGTAIGGMLHTFPFLISNIHIALHIAYIVVAIELIGIAFIRYRYMKTALAKTLLQVIVGGSIVFGIGVLLGKLNIAP